MLVNLSYQKQKYTTKFYMYLIITYLLKMSRNYLISNFITNWPKLSHFKHNLKTSRLSIKNKEIKVYTQPIETILINLNSHI